MSKSILQQAKESFNDHNVTYLTTSSVWDYYNSGSYSELAKNTKSNLHSSLKKVFKDKKVKLALVTVGAKGRSAHSATEILIFDATNINKMGCFANDTFINAF